MLDDLTAADVMMGYGLLWTKRFGLLGEQYANLGASLARLESRPALQAAW